MTLTILHNNLRSLKLMGINRKKKEVNMKMPQIDSKRAGKRGWFGESGRHAMAAKGIRTGRKIPERSPTRPKESVTKQEQKEVLEQAEELEEKAEELEETAEEIKEEAEELEEESKELKEEAKDVSEEVEEALE